MEGVMSYKTCYKNIFYILTLFILVFIFSACCCEQDKRTYAECEAELAKNESQLNEDYSKPGLLLLTKTSDKQVYSSVGEVITYTYKITRSTDSLIQKNLVVNDDKVPLSCTSSVIDVGQIITCKGSYTVTEQDLINGKIENQAVATTTTPYTLSCSYYVNDTMQTMTKNLSYKETASASLTITGNASPSLSLSKTANPSSYSGYQDVAYTYTLTNTGNVTLKPEFTISDNLIDSWYCDGHTSLQPGETMQCYGSYVIDAGLRWTITNTATACGYFGDIQICSNSASASVIFLQPENPDEPISGHCGDGIVQFELGEECDPPEPGLCSSECKYE